MLRGRLKPSKPMALLNMVGGIVMVFIGLTTIVPKFGPFGFFWTLIALSITAFYAYNFFSAKGVSFYEVDVQQQISPMNVSAT